MRAWSPTGTGAVLHAFGNTDGHHPDFGVFSAGCAGNLYGMTYAGGGADMGIVFKVAARVKETIVYGFTGGADMGFPESGLIEGKAGHFYATTGGNPPHTYGTVFKLKP
jgi:uncharacterized repeat protein (TIGR03803 family)